MGQAWMRIGKEKIRVSGDLRSMRLKLSGRRIVEINGKEIAVRFENGVLSVGP